MRRFQQLLPFMAAFLVFVLQCSQTCLAAGHAQAAVTTRTTPHDSEEHSPCHATGTASGESSEQCLDCGGHVFLRSAPDGTEPLMTLPFLFLSVPAPSLLPASLKLYTSRWWQEFLGNSPPRYLSLSVFRL
jgi:hypothetical protein